MSTIKKKTLYFIVFVMLLMAVLFVYKFHAGKTQDELIGVLRRELQLPEDDATVISCVGEYEIGKSALLWFHVENQPLTYYRAVACSVVAEGRYQVKAIHTPMTYAQDIVHVVWKAEDVFLMNNPACRSIVYRDRSGDVVSETKIAASDIPYGFLHKPADEFICDFLDAEGNEIR